MRIAARPPLLCLSHLRWDFVWQRPQQLMSRFGQDRRVFFVEEPIFRENAGEAPQEARLETREAEGVTVCQPICRDPGPGGGPRLDAMFAKLVGELVRQQELHDFTAWLYTPMLVRALDRVEPALMVYDAMDELSLFRGASPELLPRERELLERADVVFTGGVSLGEAKARHHGNVHPFPSGVEIDHYRRALDPAEPIPEDAAALPHPQIGFFGVIDERIDLPLLHAVAEARPDWQLVMLGPVVKIDAAELPRASNLHYLGQKHYKDLPGYVKSFDVCMMPFALNDATKFISPTKTLEYMAAHKPIVSTPVADVVGSYAGAVRTAPSPETFVSEVERALAEGEAERRARIAKEHQILSRSTWDAIVERMDQRLREAERASQPSVPATRPTGSTTPAAAGV
jgi:UDP-galactopyranose mutase